MKSKLLVKCPFCGEKSLGKLRIEDKNSEFNGWPANYAQADQQIVCLSCKNKFVRWRCDNV